MAQPKPEPRIYLKGSLPRARADAAARLAAGDFVDSYDLGGGRLVDDFEPVTTVKRLPDEPHKPAD
jgi:hypothetical protein